MLEDEIYNENLVDDPNDLERIIEGEDITERNNVDNSGNETEGNEGEEKQNDDEGKKVELKKKRSVNPQPKLNAERLKGPRGIGILESFFQNVKLKGKDHEKEDLDVVMRHLEHWAHRLYPRFKFDDCLEKIEKLGTKRPIQNYLQRIRLGMEEEDTPRLTEDPEEPPPSPPMADPFDELIGHRPSQPTSQPIVNLNYEQRERMLRNRMIAEERRMARMKAQQEKQRIQSELSSRENNDGFTLENSQTTTNSSSIFQNNKENSLDLHIDEINPVEVNTNCSVKNKETSVHTLEGGDQGSSLHNNDAEISDTGILSQKETERDETVSEEPADLFITDSNNEISIIEAQRERMLQNKRKAEQLINSRKKAKLESVLHKEIHSETECISIEHEDEIQPKYWNDDEKTLQNKEVETNIERTEEAVGEKIVQEQSILDLKTNINEEIVEYSVGECTGSDKKLSQETKNVSKSSEEMFNENSRKKEIIDCKTNDADIVRVEILDYDSINNEEKLYQETKDVSKSVEEKCNESSKEKEIIDCKTNVETLDSDSINNEKKLDHEVKDINNENSKEANGESVIQEEETEEAVGIRMEN